MPISERLPLPWLPSLAPNLPTLCDKAGKREALRRNDVPNLPSIPNIRRVCMRVHPSAPTPAYTRACTCVSQSKKGWEGWEGWEEAATERVLDSQPETTGWEGWEGGWGNA